MKPHLVHITLSALLPPLCLHASSSACGAVGGHGVGALQDHGAGAGGGRPPAQAAGVAAEGGRRLSVPAADQQPEGSGSVSGEEGLWGRPGRCCVQQLHDSHHL